MARGSAARADSRYVIEKGARSLGGSVTGIEALKLKIAREHGLDCGQFKASFFLRRLEARLRQTEQSSIRGYLGLLDRDGAETGRLLAMLSINVTQFFRDESTFDAIRTRVLRPLLARRAMGTRRMLRVWSAGCASGQETYSLAMLLAEALEGHPGRVMARVYGTDRDPDAVEHARRGEYGRSEMEGVPSAHALRHFDANGCYRVAPDIRRFVRFRVHDLLRDPPLRQVDLLVCRNVLIYLSSSRHARERLVQRFHDALRPGGFLVLGKTEALGALAKRRFVPLDLKERIYQKSIGSSQGGL